MSWLGPNLKFHLEHSAFRFEHFLAITTETLNNVNLSELDYLFVQLEHLQIQHQTKSGPKWRAELGRPGLWRLVARTLLQQQTHQYSGDTLQHLISMSSDVAGNEIQLVTFLK